MRLHSIALAILVAGCMPSDQVATTPPPPPVAKPIPALKITCPKVDIFSADDKNAIADMLSAFPDGSPQIRMGIEWNRLHADAVACQYANSH